MDEDNRGNFIPPRWRPDVQIDPEIFSQLLLLVILYYVNRPNVIVHWRYMQFYLLRLVTYRNFPRNRLDVRDLVRTGFYYLETEDYVICYHCGLQIGDWRLTDVPEDVHRRLSPECLALREGSRMVAPRVRFVQAVRPRYMLRGLSPPSDENRFGENEFRGMYPSLALEVNRHLESNASFHEADIVNQYGIQYRSNVSLGSAHSFSVLSDIINNIDNRSQSVNVVNNLDVILSMHTTSEADLLQIPLPEPTTEVEVESDYRDPDETERKIDFLPESYFNRENRHYDVALFTRSINSESSCDVSDVIEHRKTELEENLWPHFASQGNDFYQAERTGNSKESSIDVSSLSEQASSHSVHHDGSFKSLDESTSLEVCSSSTETQLLKSHSSNTVWHSHICEQGQGEEIFAKFSGNEVHTTDLNAEQSVYESCASKPAIEIHEKHVKTSDLEGDLDQTSVKGNGKQLFASNKALETDDISTTTGSGDLEKKPSDTKPIGQNSILQSVPPEGCDVEERTEGNEKQVFASNKALENDDISRTTDDKDLAKIPPDVESFGEESLLHSVPSKGCNDEDKTEASNMISEINSSKGRDSDKVSTKAKTDKQIAFLSATQPQESFADSVEKENGEELFAKTNIDNGKENLEQALTFRSELFEDHTKNENLVLEKCSSKSAKEIQGQFLKTPDVEASNIDSCKGRGSENVSKKATTNQPEAFLLPTQPQESFADGVKKDYREKMFDKTNNNNGKENLEQAPFKGSELFQDHTETENLVLEQCSSKPAKEIEEQPLNTPDTSDVDRELAQTVITAEKVKVVLTSDDPLKEDDNSLTSEGVDLDQPSSAKPYGQELLLQSILTERCINIDKIEEAEKGKVAFVSNGAVKTDDNALTSEDADLEQLSSAKPYGQESFLQLFPTEGCLNDDNIRDMQQNSSLYNTGMEWQNTDQDDSVREENQSPKTGRGSSRIRQPSESSDTSLIAIGQRHSGLSQESFTSGSSEEKKKGIMGGDVGYSTGKCPVLADIRENANRHNAKVKFICRICNKTFLDDKGVESHLQFVHYGICYRCNGCKREFRYKDARHTCIRGKNVVAYNKTSQLEGPEAEIEANTYAERMKNDIVVKQLDKGMHMQKERIIKTNNNKKIKTSEEMKISQSNSKKTFRPQTMTGTSRRHGKTRNQQKKNNKDRSKRKENEQKLEQQPDGSNDLHPGCLSLSTSLKGHIDNGMDRSFDDTTLIDIETEVYKEVQAPQQQQQQQQISTMDIAALIKKQHNGRIELNIGGTVFYTSIVTLCNGHGSVFKKLLSDLFAESLQDNCIFIDRDPHYFGFILNFLRNNCKLPDTLFPTKRASLMALLLEARFYNIEELVLELNNCLKRCNAMYDFGLSN